MGAVTTGDASEDAASYADLAYVVLRAARELGMRGYRDPDVIALSQSSIIVMNYIDDHPGATPSAVAEGSGLRRSNLSASLRELEKLGFVRRSEDATDGRSVRLYPTRLVEQNLAKVRAEWSDSIEEGLGIDVDVSEAVRTLSHLIDGLVTARLQSNVPLDKDSSVAL
jgi:DNA-binding MarR family transcriptional regulator